MAGQVLHVLKRGTFCSKRSVTVVTRNECGEKCPGKPALFSRRFIIRQMSIPVIAFLVSVFVLRYAVRKRRPSVIWAASMYSRRNCSRSCRTGISRDLPPFSEKRSEYCAPSCLRLLRVSLATAPTRAAV